MKKYMKKRMIILSGIVVLGILVVFKIGMISMDVSLKPTQKTYPVGTSSVTAVFKNVMPGQYDMGRRYILEKYIDGRWETVTKDERGAFFTDDSFSPSWGTKITFDITKYSDGLTEGTYRIKVTMHDTEERTLKDIMFEFSVA